MRFRHSGLLRGLAGLLLCGLARQGGAAVVTPPLTLADADRHWTQKSYARALTDYETLQKSGQVPAARQDEIAYRVAVLPGKINQWDRALAGGLGFVQSHRGTIWEARGLYWLGRLYLTVPHQGYRVTTIGGSRTFRGDDVPTSQGDAKPVSVDVTVRDRRNALDALEAAHILYARQTGGMNGGAGNSARSEQAQLDFDLIHVLEQDTDFPAWAQKMAWLPPNDASWRIDAAQPYDPRWPQPKKILYLHRGLIQNGAAQHSGGHPTGALGLWSEALWLRQYQQQMRGWAIKYERNKAIQVPFPYQDMRPSEPLTQLVQTYPDDSLRDQAQIVLAGWQAQDGDLRGALGACRRFLAQRPRSPYTSDARAQIAALLAPSVSVSVLNAPRPGHAPRFQVSYRNTARTHFDAYRIDLPRLLAQRNDTWDNENWGQLEGLIGGSQAELRRYARRMQYANLRHIKPMGKLPSLSARLSAIGARRVAAWDVQTQDTGDLKPRVQNIVAPFRAAGAYIVVASVPGQRFGLLVPVSDLVLAQKKGHGSSLFYVADGETGRPQPGVRIVAKLLWHKSRQVESSRAPVETWGARVTNAISGADGVSTIPLQYEPNADNTRLAAIAWTGQRFALIGPQYVDNSPNAPTPQQYKGYATTDRAVYRPLQVVQFRQLLMRQRAAQAARQGDLRPLAGRMARVVVSDPQGNTIFKQRTRCSAWGSVSGRFTLPDHAPLGEYNIEVTLPREGTGNRKQGTEDADEPIDNAGNRFRVEEYKKPEYEVTVTPAADRVRLGQPTRAKIHAAYYFGGPVAGASVTYRVYRNLYAPSFRFPEPYDYLYHSDTNKGDYDTNYRSGEVIAQGKARLDSRGDAFVTFATRADGQGGRDSDLKLTVEADVQDQSRRVISGMGALKATKHDVAVFLRFGHGYATQGDRVDVEVKTLNPSDQPVSVGGMARVYRQSNTPADPNYEAPPSGIRRGETLVWSAPVRTDAQGYGSIGWKANTSGYFRIAFETQDADSSPNPNAPANSANTANAANAVANSGKDNLVSGDTLVWVDGPELRSRRFLFGGITLAVKNPYYQEGQTARALLVTPEPGCTVLLTREVDGRILDRRIVRVPGRSLEVPVSITKRDVPNVFLSALMIRHGEMFQTEQELFVPPIQQTARVTVTPDKPRYAPGQKAHLRLTARDYLGRPLRAELSVSIADAALSYIQKDYAPDIRAYFYGDRRQQNIDNQGSSQTNFIPLSEQTGALATYPRHPFTMPDGMDQLHTQEIYGNYFGMQATDGLAMDQGANLYLDASGVYHAQIPSPASPPMGRVIRQAQLTSTISGRNGNGAIGGESYYENGSVQRYSRRGPMLVNGPARFQMTNESNINLGSMDRSDLTGKADAFNTKYKHAHAPGELAPATTRSNFRDTAFWTPSVTTDAQGHADIAVTWPDNLTQWRANVIGSTQAAQVGTGEARVTTKKDLLVQLESPRFVVERDVVVLSAVVHNDTDRAQRIRVRLDLDNADVVAEDLAEEGKRGRGDKETRRQGGQGAGSNLRLTSREPRTTNHEPDEPRLRVRTLETWVTIAPAAQQRVDWLARPQHPGVMHARMTAQGQTDADAAQTVIPILVHGVERTVVQSGMLKAAANAKVTITLPAERKAGSSRLVVTLNPSLAGVMLDALPYLADYPYGCVEQTLSRFVPSVQVARSLKASGYNLADLERAALHHGAVRAQTIRGMQTPRVANSAYTYPDAAPGVAHQEIDGAGERWRNPVFSQSELNKMTRDGLARLKDMQHSDGGWGWWADDTSDPYMTTHVLYGLQQAQIAGVTVDADELARGLSYLRARYLAETDLEQMAFEARVLALAAPTRAAIRNRVEKRLYVQREKLGAYGKALLALALHDLGQTAQAKIVLDNLENTAHLDEANGTVYWDDINTQWWRWYNNKIEANATILMAYTAIAPDAKLPALLVKWLVNNRKGTTWRDTRDTALTVGALAEWARVRRELNPDYTLTADLGGRIRRVYHITHENALLGDNTFVVPDALLQTGNQTLTLTRQGAGTCYYAATTSTFSQEEPIAAASSEIHVTRRYFRLIANTAGQEQGESEKEKGESSVNDTLSFLLSPFSSHPNPFLTGRYDLLEQGGETVNGEDTVQGPRYDRIELRPGELLNSGDLLEVELGLEARNDYDYVLFEDMKPAGCEPVEQRSGAHQGLGVYANMELRDEKVAFFLTSLPQGRRVLSYRLRAETPGAFHVLPTSGYAMYAPDVRALSDETRINIRDEEPALTARASD